MNESQVNVEYDSEDAIWRRACQLVGMTFRDVLDLGIAPDGVEREYNSRRYKGEIVGAAYGDVGITGLTVIFRSALNAVEGQDVTISNSSLTVNDAAGEALNVFANGTMDIAESAVDTGTASWNDNVGFVGYIYSEGQLTVNNSNVSVRLPEGWVAEADGGRASMSVSSKAAVNLICMDNGEVRHGDVYCYVDTGHGDSVYLKAANTSSC